MPDLKSIGAEHLKSASKLSESVRSGLLIFFSLVAFCWLSSEYIFSQIKYERIRLRGLESRPLPSKTNSLFLYSERVNAIYFKQNSKLLDSLKSRLKKEEDSLAQNTLKIAEDNIPKTLNFFLKQSSKAPFGLLLSSVIVFAFLVYLFDLRRQYISKIALGLRIFNEEDGGFNKIMDYNISLPFWAFPLNHTFSKGPSSLDILTIGGWRKNKKEHYFIIATLLILINIIQIRLYYIALISDSYLLSWVISVQCLILFLSFALSIIWMLPTNINNSYNSEEIEALGKKQTRRNFIVVSTFATLGIILAARSITLSKRIVNAFLRPRFRTKRESKGPSKSLIIERQALGFLKVKEYEMAANFIYSFLLKTDKKEQVRFIRLFDLLVLVCFKYPSVNKKYFDLAVRLAKRSGNKILIGKSRSWVGNKVRLEKYAPGRLSWNGQKI